MLKEEITTHEVFPFPDLIFNIFNYVEPDDIRVVILGQDPYFKCEIHKDKKIPQAMGFSFSVPIGMTIPSSLSNIFRNQDEFHIIQDAQPHGNLLYWIDQGCFLMNTALTVRENSAGSHCQYWKKITDKIIRHISTELNDITFVLWGGD
jgi:uracil-DNA glycosylase